jgi:hypothetical protein
VNKIQVFEIDQLVIPHIKKKRAMKVLGMEMDYLYLILSYQEERRTRTRPRSRR